MSYTTFDIIKKLNIPRGNLQQYIDRGIIEPSVEKASGKGTKNLFSKNDLYRIKAFQLLFRVGLAQKHAFNLAEFIKFEQVGSGACLNWFYIYYPGIDSSEPIYSQMNREALNIRINNQKDPVIFIKIDLLRIKKEVDSLFE